MVGWTPEFIPRKKFRPPHDCRCQVSTDLQLWGFTELRYHYVEHSCNGVLIFCGCFILHAKVWVGCLNPYPAKVQATKSHVFATWSNIILCCFALGVEVRVRVGVGYLNRCGEMNSGTPTTHVGSLVGYRLSLREYPRHTKKSSEKRGCYCRPTRFANLAKYSVIKSSPGQDIRTPTLLGVWKYARAG